MELDIYNISGEKLSRTVTLDEAVFNIEPNDHAIYLDTKLFLANRRQGTHKSKEKWEVMGSTRKLKRQKGTGGARSGSAKSPLFVGGGRIFGPKPRDYEFKLNKKLKKLARKSALTYKAKDNQIIILEDFTIEEPRTRLFAEILKNLQLDGKKTLLVMNGADQNLLLATRNVQKAKVARPADLNTYDILNANSLLIVESSLKEVEQVNQ